MSFGSSSSKGSSSQWSPYAGTLAQWGLAELKAANPVLQGLLTQEGEALRTGGITNQIPIMNRRVDAARQAASQSNQQTQELLSKYDLANSSFGASTIAQLNQKANAEVAQIPADVTQDILNQAPTVAGEVSSLGANLLGTGAGLDINRRESSSGMQFGANLEDLAALLGSFGSGAGGSGGMGAGSGIATSPGSFLS